MSRPVVYVAGPYRARTPGPGGGYNHWAQEQNIRQAEDVALDVWRLGGAAVCPHLNTAHFQGALPDEVWLQGDLDILARCDAVMLVPGWEDSTGTRAEVAFADAHGIPTFEHLFELDYWLRNEFAPHPTR